MGEHPFEIGARVRHDGIRYSTDAFATVLEVKPQRGGTFEYRVLVDAGHQFAMGDEPRETWWASYHTCLGD